MARSVAKTLPAIAAISGLVALVLAVAWTVADRSVAPPPTAPTAFKSYPRVGILADDGGWIDQVAADRCWSVTTRSAEVDTGYISPGGTPQTSSFPNRVNQVVAGQPAVVLVQGGLHDYQASETQLFDAATTVFTSLRKQAPEQTTIVAIGPVAPPGVAPQDAARISRPIAAAAANSGVEFIDPIAEGWLPGPEEFVNRLKADLRQLDVPAGC